MFQDVIHVYMLQLEFIKEYLETYRVIVLVFFPGKVGMIIQSVWPFVLSHRANRVWHYDQYDGIEKTEIKDLREKLNNTPIA